MCLRRLEYFNEIVRFNKMAFKWLKLKTKGTITPFQRI